MENIDDIDYNTSSLSVQVPTSIVAKNPHFAATSINCKDKQNWLVHVLFLR